MYLKRIDMHGFKSFADPVSIEFHDGITCIVGPNGSGKSNISDAVRWVLGEQSPKALRGGKMEEVIFAGTASRKSRGMAEVTLVVDNVTGILPIDYAEVAITRRMYRSGESEYSINNNACRLRDIRELIMDTGIGVDGYSLIGQGKISEIVSNKPESRREIFEEAAGIVKYRTKKAEAEKKLESSTANLDRVNDIIGELESRINGLKDDSEKASEYLVLREQYKSVEINVTLKNVENIEVKNEYLKDELVEVNAQIDGFKDEKKAVDEEVTRLKTENEQLEQRNLALRDKLLRQVEEINRLSSENQLHTQKLSTLDQEKERLLAEAETILEKLAEEKTHLAEAEGNSRAAEEKLAVLSQRLQEKAEELSTLTEDARKTATEVDESKGLIYELSSQVSSKKAELSSLQQLADTLDRRKQLLLDAKQQAETEKTTLLSRQTEAEDKKNQIQKLLSETIEESTRLREQAGRDAYAEQELGKKLSQLQLNASQLSTQKKMIEDMEQSYEGYSGAVRFVMRSSHLKGILGVVAELIQVPEGMEKAIETALGGQLQNVVCESDRNAQDAITALKSNRAGRLTFLPLSSIRGNKGNPGSNVEQAPGFRGVGTACVSFDEKYRSVMEYLLGRVIVMDNLDNAVKLSKSISGGYRLVTLDGEVVNASGAITGGAYRNNSANLLERKTEVKKLTSSLAELDRERVETETKLNQLKVSIQQQQREVSALEKKRQETEIQLVNIENQVQNLANSLCDLEVANERRFKELQSLDEEARSSGGMTDRLKAEIRQGELDMAQAEQAAVEKSGDYSEKQVTLEKVSEELTALRLSEETLKGERNSAAQMVERIGRYVRELEEDKKRRASAAEAIDGKKAELQNQNLKVSQALEQAAQEKEDTENELKKKEAEKTTLNQYLKDIEAKKGKMDDVLFGYQSQKHELELKLAKNEAQVDSLKEKLWTEFEISYVQAIEFKKKDFVMASAMKELREIKTRMKELGEVNIGAIKEYETVKERYEFLSEQREDLLTAMNNLNQIISDMDKTIRINFKKSFDEIMVNFEKSFRELFGGGFAELRLEDESRPLESGIEIIAQPPGKKLQNINLMSGGEKTMTAIALMFAVLKAKPTPFCILDEVEAALDEANINRFARYLQNFKEIQFALVTHQKATMEFANVLYGVTMAEQGISKVISLRLGDEFEL